MDIIKTEVAIRSRVLLITDILPEIEFQENCKNIIVSFRGNIPDEETTVELENVLKVFGTPIPNHCREKLVVSFTISR